MAFRGSLSSWMGGGHGLTRPIASANFLEFSAGFLSNVSWWVKTLLHFEAVINPALFTLPLLSRQLFSQPAFVLYH